MVAFVMGATGRICLLFFRLDLDVHAMFYAQ